MKEKFIVYGKRALHTMAQTAVSVIGTSAVLEEVNWIAVLSATVLAGLISMLKSFAVGVPELDESDDDEWEDDEI